MAVPKSVNKMKKTLLLLAHSKPAAVKKIIKNANRDLLKAISEISLNMLQGNLPLNPTQKSKLRRHRHTMRKITEKNTNLTAKRKYIQKGGFIGSLLAASLPFLLKGVSSLIGLIKKKKPTKYRRT